MGNHANPQTGVQKFNLTTKSLGIADANAKDLAGFMLNSSDLATAATKILINVGISSDAIRCVKVGADPDGNLKILAEVLKKSLTKKKASSDWIELDDCDYEDDRNIFPKEFFGALKNKVYYKHLDYKIVHRRTKKNKQEKFVQISFDPEILIAFAYNLDYSDPYYRISCIKHHWMSNKELKKKYDSNKKIRKYNETKNEYLSDKLCHCTVVVTHKIARERETALYTSMMSSIAADLSKALNMPVEQITSHLKKAYNLERFMGAFNNTLSSGDFHPKQVSQFNGDDDEDEE